MSGVPRFTYHDLAFQFGDGPRTLVFDAPFSVMVACTRVGGWELYVHDGKDYIVRAGEYNVGFPLKLWVGDVQICGASDT